MKPAEVPRHGPEDGNRLNALVERPGEPPLHLGQVPVADGEGEILEAEHRAVADAAEHVLDLYRRT